MTLKPSEAFEDPVRFKKLTDRWNRITNIGGVTVNKDVSVSEVEKRYLRVFDVYKQFYTKRWRPAFDAVVKAKQAHAKPSHKHTCMGKIEPDGTVCECWWLYKGYINDWGTSIGFDWVAKPKKPKNLKVGQAYYDVDQRSNIVHGRKLRFGAVLDSMIIGELYKQLPHPNKSGPKIVRVIVNDRVYWYQTISYHHGGLIWSRLAWPEDELQGVVLK